MKLIYHPLSPFSRKVYILALELSLAKSITLEKVVVAPVFFPGWSDNNADVSAAGNPIAKIPTLVVDDFEGGQGQSPVGIFDSKFICQYLLERAGKARRVGDGDARRYWLEQATHAACDGMMDAEVLVIYEERLREPKGLRFQAWFDGQREKVIRGLDFLQRMAEEGILRERNAGDEVSVAEIAAAVVLDWFDSRAVEWRGKRAELERWFKRVVGRESFRRAVCAREADWERANL